MFGQQVYLFGKNYVIQMYLKIVREPLKTNHLLNAL